MKTETVYGITYSKPEVVLLQETGIGVPEVAARTCYDSFDNSENDCIKAIDTLNQMGGTNTTLINNIDHSELLDSLAWTYFHHSILEHTNLSYLIKGTSRGVLQEHARHRIQAISVRSTRYTMQDIVYMFVAATASPKDSKKEFTRLIKKVSMFVVTDTPEEMEIHSLYDKLEYQRTYAVGQITFIENILSKSALAILDDIGFFHSRTYDADLLLEELRKCKSKRNVGDSLKWVVTDNWKVDMVVTFNLRSLKNYFQLRDSGAAYFQIQWLAQAMKEVTPKKYLDLIIKD